MNNLNTWRDQYVQQYNGTINSFAYNNLGVCFRDDTNRVLAGPEEICGNMQQSMPNWDGHDITQYRLLRNDSYQNNGYSGSQGSINIIDWTQWSGATYGTDPNDCCSSISGSQPMIDNASRTILFSYGQALLSQTIAINQALQLSGVQVDGYTYAWTYRLISNGGNVGSEVLKFTVDVKDSSGNIVESHTYDYSAGIGSVDNWSTVKGLEVFSTPYTDPQSITLKILGKDGGYWGGYYGPEVKDVSLNLIYRSNPCSIDPLYDPSCPGYALALAEQIFNQQCSANPLYDISCPGYQEAYKTQQCTADPLYDASCPGYAEAYYNQQCSINALYDTGCNGYAEAYFNQQCSLNPLYNTGCTGYAQAYFNQQCSLNPLYNIACTGYAEAYYNQQCSISALYDAGCPGYAEAYFNQQCTADALYDKTCPGYETAYYEKYIKPGLEQQTAEASGSSTTTTPTSTPSAVTDTGAVSTTGSTVVDNVISAPPTTSVTSVTNTVPGVSVITIEPPVTETTVAETKTEEPVAEEKASEEKAAEETVASIEAEAKSEDPKSTNNSTTKDSGSNETKTAKAQPTEQQKTDSKREKIKEILTEKLKELANQMGQAASLEQQAAVQAQITALIAYVPGFNAYGQLAIPGVDFYADEEIYKNARIPDAKRGARNGLAQQVLWDKMVDMQYNKEDQ